MNIRRLISRSVPLGAIAVLGGTLLPAPQVASAAGATITASVVNGNAGHIKVTGSGFTKYATVTIEFDQNENGAYLQDYTVKANQYGKISTPSGGEPAYITAACLVGVTAWDSTHTSNTYTLGTYALGCPSAMIQTNPCGAGCHLADLLITGTGFTPGSQSIYVEVDGGAMGPVGINATACGSLNPGPYPPAPAGQIQESGGPACGGIPIHSDYWCPPFTNNTITVWAEDYSVDYVTPTETVDTNQLC